MQLIVFTGIPASGKSTFYQQYFYHTHLRLNLDMLKTRHRERLLFEAALSSQTKIVIDNTNPSAQDRQRYIQAAQTLGYDIVSYYFDTDLRSAIARNHQRQGKAKIPVVGIKTKFKQLEVPQYSEGFSDIYQVHIVSNGQFGIRHMPNDSEEHA